MTVHDIVTAIVEFVRAHESWAAPVAFFVAFMESFCFVSILWPGTAILVGITALLAASGASQAILVPAIIAAGFGGTLGYAVSYWIGRYFEEAVPNIWPFSRQPELIRHGENFFRRWGVWGVFFGHFFGPIRAVIPVVAGMFRMSQAPFQIANAVSAFIWAAGIIAPSFFMVTFREDIIAFIRDHQLIFAGVLFVIAFLNSIPMPVLAIPTLLLFIAVGGVYVYAGGNILLGFTLAAAGAFSGDLVGYHKGYSDIRSVHQVWPNSWGKDSAESAVNFIRRNGAPGMIPSKFHTTLRSFAPMVAGDEKIAYLPFLVLTFASCMLWAAVLLAPVFIFQTVTGS